MTVSTTPARARTDASHPPTAAHPDTHGAEATLTAIGGLRRARTVPVVTGTALVVPVVLLGAGGSLPLLLGLPLVFGPIVGCSACIARRVARNGGPALGSAR